MTVSDSVGAAVDRAVSYLFSRQRDDGFWTDTLPSSAVATAPALIGLHYHDREAHVTELETGCAWLRETQLPDGGWGDTPDTHGNLHATAFAVGALAIVDPENSGEALKKGMRFVEKTGGIDAIADRRRTPLGPIAVTFWALGGLCDARYVPKIPSEIALVRKVLRHRMSFTVPGLFQDREKFEIWARDLDDVSGGGEVAAAAFGAFLDYLRGLVESKRSEPAQDVISDLVAAADAWGLGTDDIATYALVLLYVGHPSTATHINTGVALLLTNPDQRAALADTPSLIGGAVEEILRLVPLGNRFGLLRYAHADIPIGGVTIARGDGVLLMHTAANRDPAAFADPGRMDITRRPNAHLAFGQGARRCLGANLARLELTAVFRTLFQRFPDLALAEPVERLETYKVHVVERLARLPVTW